MNEHERLDALHQRDQGIGVPYPEEATAEDIHVVCGEHKEEEAECNV